MDVTNGLVFFLFGIFDHADSSWLIVSGKFHHSSRAGKFGHLWYNRSPCHRGCGWSRSVHDTQTENHPRSDVGRILEKSGSLLLTSPFSMIECTHENNNQNHGQNEHNNGPASRIADFLDTRWKGIPTRYLGIWQHILELWRLYSWNSDDQQWGSVKRYFQKSWQCHRASYRSRKGYRSDNWKSNFCENSPRSGYGSRATSRIIPTRPDDLRQNQL